MSYVYDTVVLEQWKASQEAQNGCEDNGGYVHEFQCERPLPKAPEAEAKRKHPKNENDQLTNDKHMKR